MYFLLLYRRYLKDEHKARKDTELDGTKWTIGSLRASVSQIHWRAKLPVLFFCLTFTVYAPLPFL